MQTKDLAAEDVGGQTEQVMKNLGAVLEASGSSFSQVVKTTVLLADMADFSTVNAIYGTDAIAANSKKYTALLVIFDVIACCSKMYSSTC